MVSGLVLLLQPLHSHVTAQLLPPATLYSLLDLGQEGLLLFTLSQGDILVAGVLGCGGVLRLVECVDVGIVVWRVPSTLVPTVSLLLFLVTQNIHHGTSTATICLRGNVW